MLRHSIETLEYKIMDYKLIELGVHGDKKGLLSALEEGNPLPFHVQRVYYIWGTEQDAIRGCHAHRHCHEMIICLSGSCDFLLDDGTSRETVRMDSPSRGLYAPPHIWRQFTNFSPDCVVLVLASIKYDRSDYIEDYEEFKKITNP